MKKLIRLNMIPAKVDYVAKSLLTGYRLGLKEANLYVGIPVKYWQGQMIRIRYKNEVKEFCFDQIKHRQEFNDKFIPGATYTLLYVLWRRVKKGDLHGQAY